jgi:hypothetical protein
MQGHYEEGGQDDRQLDSWEPEHDVGPSLPRTASRRRYCASVDNRPITGYMDWITAQAVVDAHNKEIEPCAASEPVDHMSTVLYEHFSFTRGSRS